MARSSKFVNYSLWSNSSVGINSIRELQGFLTDFVTDVDRVNILTFSEKVLKTLGMVIQLIWKLIMSHPSYFLALQDSFVDFHECRIHRPSGSLPDRAKALCRVLTRLSTELEIPELSYVNARPSRKITLNEDSIRAYLQEMDAFNADEKWTACMFSSKISREAQLNIKRRERPSPQPSPKVGEGARVRFPFSYFGRRG
jgi:hypothetical protein